MNTISSNTEAVIKNEQIDEAQAYLDKHKIQFILEQVTQALVYERPKNPTEFIIKKLENIRGAHARGQTFVQFTRDNAAATFRILDVVGRNKITISQYLQGMKTLGVVSPNMKPTGYQNDAISIEVFVEEAMNSLKKI